MGADGFCPYVPARQDTVGLSAALSRLPARFLEQVPESTQMG